MVRVRSCARRARRKIRLLTAQLSGSLGFDFAQETSASLLDVMLHRGDSLVEISGIVIGPALPIQSGIGTDFRFELVENGKEFRLSELGLKKCFQPIEKTFSQRRLA